MAFTTIAKDRRGLTGRAPATNKVRLCYNAKAENLALCISSDLLAAVSLDKHAAIMIGGGADAGKLLIRPALAGYRVRRPGRAHAALVTVPAAVPFRKKPTVTTTVRHEVTSDGLVVDLSPFLLPASEGNGIAAVSNLEAGAA